MAASGIILAFHQTSDKHYPGVNNLKPGYFHAVIHLLQEWGYEIWNEQVALREALASPYGVITFDDGYEGNFELFKVLCRENIRPIVFVPSRFIGRRNSWEYCSSFFPARHLNEDQIKELSDMGAILGSHGASHQALTSLPLSEIQAELMESRGKIEAICGQKVDLISFPFGRFNGDVTRIARELGYRHGLTIGVSPVAEEKDDFVLNRIAIYGFDDFYSLRLKISGQSPVESMKRAVTTRLAGGTIVLKSPLK